MTLADEDAFLEIVNIFKNVDQSLDHSLVIADSVATAISQLGERSEPPFHSLELLLRQCLYYI